MTTDETLEFAYEMRRWDTIDFEEREHWLEHIGGDISYAALSWHDVPRELQEELSLHQLGWWDDNCECKG